jgi:DNA-binding LacI/PurR family transcriptional regulator
MTTVTLATVARKAGVSTMAASYALRQGERGGGVSAATRTRILAVAKELGYHPNPYAASLRTRRTQTLGLCLPGDTQAYFGQSFNVEWFGALIEHISRIGYQILVLRDNWTTPPNPRLMDGCIFLESIPPAHVNEVERLAARIPVLTPAQPVKNVIQLQANTDNAYPAGALMAADYLYDLGHRHMAIVEIQESHRIDHARTALFEQTARQRGIDVSLHPFSDRYQERLYPSIPQILDLAPLPTALVALDDDYARVLIDHLALKGLRVPRDVSVFSGHTLPDGFQSVPALTGITFGMKDIYRAMVDRFVDIVEGRSTATAITLPPRHVQLVERESCRPRDK